MFRMRRERGRLAVPIGQKMNPLDKAISEIQVQSMTFT